MIYIILLYHMYWLINELKPGTLMDQMINCVPNDVALWYFCLVLLGQYSLIHLSYDNNGINNHTVYFRVKFYIYAIKQGAPKSVSQNVWSIFWIRNGGGGGEDSFQTPQW